MSMPDVYTFPQRGFQGRIWDSPMFDDLPKIDLANETCGMCQEGIVGSDDAIRTPSVFHTECLLRSIVGDVPHLEGRCSCYGGGAHDDEGTYRETAQRAIAWLVENGRGRWA